MKPLDPRLVRYARSTRGFLVLAVVLGVVAALLVILQARLLADVIVSVTGDGSAWDAVAPTVVAVGAVFCTRAVLAWLVEVVAVRASSRAKAELRQAAVEHVLALGPASSATADPGELAALMTRGIDALDSYFARYLPQLVLSVVVPVAVLLTVLGQDVLSAVIIAVTLPLIPVFMILIGMYTRARVDRQWRTLAVLSGHFLDLVSGLPTLVVFGRAKEQARAIREIGDRYRSTTMGVLRVSFLSSLALELLATLSVALVAVSVGLRLAEGQIAYAVALFVLLLAPEAYLPLRLVGQHFHAAAEGLGAADRLFAVIEHPLPGSGTDVLPEGPVTIHVDGLCVRYPGREEGLGAATFVARPGTVTAIVGASGGGKSTLLATLLGFVPLTSGGLDVEAGGARRPVASLDPSRWRSRLAWLPQQAHLVDAHLADRPSIADVVRIGRDGISDDDVWVALDAVGFADEVRDLPDGIATRLAPDGSGLSVGQQQRLAFARALVGSADVVLLDEPTAALDPATERVGVGAIRQLAERGATVIVVAHRPALVAIADQVVRLDRPAEDAVVAGAAHGIGDHVTREGW